MRMKRYIISTVVPGANPNKAFIKALNNYKQYNSNTELLYIASSNLYKKDKIHPYFLSQNILEQDKALNSNIKVSLMPINPEAIDPIIGLDRLSHITGSIVYASPKQRLKSIPAPKSALPRVLMTPGAATLPYYKGTRKSIIAAMDHVNGALVVEVVNNQLYHFRHITAEKDGSFFDLGYHYKPNVKSPKKVRLKAIIPGDYHCGYTDKDVKKALLEMLRIHKPEYLLLHDFFDGTSVNPHIRNRILERASLKDKNSVEEELKLCSSELKDLTKYPKFVKIVKSNHDDFLFRWLNDGVYVNDERNHVIGLELALAMAKGLNPVEYGIRKFNKFLNVEFLKEDQSFKLTPKKIEYGVHGHRGPNGSRGSIVSLEKSYGYITFGHTHSPEILRNARVIGTSTKLKLSYNEGASSWMQSMEWTYESGARQMINIINGKYAA